MMLSVDFARILNYMLAMVLSLTFHEAAHAWMANLRGDSTARDQGRLTLNPMAHIDLFGTIVLPVLGAVMHLPVIGWARPVPVDTRRLGNPRFDHMLVAAAGPLSNLTLSIAAIVLIFVYGRYATDLVPQGSFLYPLVELTSAMVYVNLGLAIFNLIPLPPLDGATVFGTLLPRDWARRYEELVAPYGALLLIVIIASGGLTWLPRVEQTIVDGVVLALRFVSGSP